jgi:PleD family two-component response regulator
VLIAPNLDAGGASALAEDLRAAIERLRLVNSEAIASDRVTVSVGVVTGRAEHDISRASFLADARATAKRAAIAGGNRVVAVDLSSP